MGLDQSYVGRNQIIPGCRSDFAPGGYGELLFLPVPGIDKLEPSFWMIGRYKDQTRLATALRSVKTKGVTQYLFIESPSLTFLSNLELFSYTSR